jgi:hypothetical protein
MDSYGYHHDIKVEFYKKMDIALEYLEKNLILEEKMNDLTEDECKKRDLFKLISIELEKEIPEEYILSLKTQHGNTQLIERIYISKIKDIFNKMGLTYKEAGSQQSKDFRNVGGIGLNIEVKKTDSCNIICNDTCPTKDIYYIIIITGKQTKTEEIKPHVMFVNGYELIKESPWIYPYNMFIEYIKDTYCRGDGKKNLCGYVAVYTRPGYSIPSLRFLFKPDKIIKKEVKTAEEKAQAKAEKEAEKQVKEADKKAAKATKEAEKLKAKAEKGTKKQQVVV